MSAESLTAPTPTPTAIPTATQKIEPEQKVTGLPGRPIPTFIPTILIPLSLCLIFRPLLLSPSSTGLVEGSGTTTAAGLTASIGDHTLPALEASVGFAILAAVGSVLVVPRVAGAFMRKGLKGRDLLKKNSYEVPESMGLPIASIYIVLLILFIPFPFTLRSQSGALKTGPFPHEELSLYLSALLSLLTATLLGFLDDIFDIRWRHKLPIPIVASVPLLLVYYAQGGLTTIVMPKGFRSIFGKVVELGPFYYVYMSLLSTFATNSINILAGINGLEVIQPLIIALSVVVNDCLYVPLPRIDLPVLGLVWEHHGVSLLGAVGGEVMVERHLLSLYFMLPLVGVCVGLLYHNWYPSRAFVGDTFCYFTGMTFACVAIISHYPKTLLLLFIPQIFNFILSCPQLFGLVVCPRHRLPKINHETGLLEPSIAMISSPTVSQPSRDDKGSEVSVKEPRWITVFCLEVFAFLGLVRLQRASDGGKETKGKGRIVSTTNLTILNFILIHVGPVREDTLTLIIVALQIAGSCLAFFIRYGAVRLFYDGDRK
ncbi:Glycosyltransferase [Phaffia rhodozyma]|uniref:UDP-N-acetylglucosamine--dolichyl-phosphate N-acetylglucosaminephosphotransferase n=1 Tax=Phaffia rhodozyma TaxID=264483 RepID=A0A0F7SJA2_PHARH|nr:Glycosyltransferase [Phaffia rhodozyma]